MSVCSVVVNIFTIGLMAEWLECHLILDCDEVSASSILYHGNFIFYTNTGVAVFYRKFRSDVTRNVTSCVQLSQ